METAREVHYPVSGNCPGKQTGTSARHRLKSQHYLPLEMSRGGGSPQHIFTDCNYLSQKTLGTFISKITAEHYSPSICLCVDFEMPRVLKEPELPVLICCLINRRIQPIPEFITCM